MSTQDALTAVQTGIALLEISQRKTFEVLDRYDLEYFKRHLEGYIAGVVAQFPLTDKATAIGDRINAWLERELAQSSTHLRQPLPNIVSPLEARFEAMIVVDWCTLLFVEVAYPGIPALNLHAEYRAGIDIDLRTVRADRQAISRQYDDLRLAFRNVMIDAGTGKLNVDEVHDTLDTLYAAGMHSLRDKVLV